MLDVVLAQQLRAAGLDWEPKPGDRFVLPLPDMRDEVFILSNVIADVHRFENGNVIGFNGTTEWASTASNRTTSSGCRARSSFATSSAPRSSGSSR